MTVRRQIVTLLLAACLLGLLVDAAPAAGPGGAAPDTIVLPGTPPTIVRVGNPLLSAAGDGISFAAHATALVRGRVRIAGSAPTTSGAVRVEQLDPLQGWVVAVAAAPVAADGSFHAIWRPKRPGSTQLRVVAGAASGSSAGAAGDTPAGTSPQLSLTVYRPGVASWYGPGAYGRTTSCGVVLRPTTIGVAHRTLPCGTQVAMYYRGRTLAVPVIDRGPFVPGRSWDLTLATFHALGGGSEGLLTLGALALPAATPARR
ncbi:MAG TPA: septal ring lytic transglycosylase RlpA family protein [Conexibacter sp.]|nr:septal ring lytic transglycosylase RlpA family protein [Conexibacter sp.]